jgi:hypothetical protein
MRYRLVSDRKRLIRREHGGVALEFAIIFPVLVLLLFGIIDFGHAWYMEHLLSNASREGARYGTRYITDVHKDRVFPQNLTPSISNYILYNSAENGNLGGWGLSHLLPSDANPQVSLSGDGYNNTSGDATTLVGEDLTVTITARKTWFVIGRLLPWLGSYKTLKVSTTMKCE